MDENGKDMNHILTNNEDKNHLKETTNKTNHKKEDSSKGKNKNNKNRKKNETHSNESEIFDKQTIFQYKNKFNNIGNNFRFYRRTNKYYGQTSYALNHVMEKELKRIGRLSRNDNLLNMNKTLNIDRTLAQMVVLNNYGLVSDRDYEKYQKIFFYKKNKLKNSIRNKSINESKGRNKDYIQIIDNSKDKGIKKYNL